jgi:hypothetical protein
LPPVATPCEGSGGAAPGGANAAGTGGGATS